MRPDRRTLKVIAIVLVWAGLARGAILHWSPYPATLDGFFYLRSLELLSASGTIPTPIDWDRVVMTAFLGSVREVLGVKALTLLQPLSAVLGLAPVLVGIVLVRRPRESARTRARGLQSRAAGRARSPPARARARGPR